ncbi:MAG: DNA repair protein RecN [Lachnospiraceae bacterium]|nr:DNA repair protein RecN [Lachnospiraceae bacterium]
MLISLHVKNLALIKEEEVTFTDGLNILTGETGAGKSIIIGSVNLALGGKADKAMIRTGEEFALIELVFLLDNDRQRQKLKELDIEPGEDDTILIKRKIYPGRTTCTVEGETVTAKELRAVSELLIDVYGQRENQSLLRRGAQLGIIDSFAGDEDAKVRAEVSASFSALKKMEKKYEEDNLDTAQRQREMDLLAYEVQEIQEAELKEGEDEELERDYRKMLGFQKITDALSESSQLSDDEETSPSSRVGRALRALNTVQGLDPDLDALTAQLADIDSLLSDFGRAVTDYSESLSFDEAAFRQTEGRLDLINRLKDKYGRTIPDILEACDKRQARLDELTDYDAAREKLRKDMAREKEHLLSLCRTLSGIRKRAAEEFKEKLTAQLLDLNFNQVDFSVEQLSGEEYLSSDGFDKITFYISMNPGESPRPLDTIASGGELSRIMLALKTVFAGKDEIHSFIFDEIDSGISGQTAWKVAEKMGRLAKDHQILCITHLAQIAAMEDAHFLIAKRVEDGRTESHITRLSEEESTRETARLLGTSSITRQALENAAELKKEAAKAKAAG